jgi:hypothetical protein
MHQNLTHEERQELKRDMEHRIERVVICGIRLDGLEGQEHRDQLAAMYEAADLLHLQLALIA